MGISKQHAQGAHATVSAPTWLPLAKFSGFEVSFCDLDSAVCKVAPRTIRDPSPFMRWGETTCPEAAVHGPAKTKTVRYLLLMFWVPFKAWPVWGVHLDAAGQWRGPLPSSEWTEHTNLPMERSENVGGQFGRLPLFNTATYHELLDCNHSKRE